MNWAMDTMTTKGISLESVFGEAMEDCEVFSRVRALGLSCRRFNDSVVIDCKVNP